MRMERLAFEVLDALGEVAMSTAEVIEAILTSPYGSSYGRLQKRTREIEQERAGVKQRSREQREFYDLLYRLKRDGFIAGKQTGNKNRWLRTAKGEKKIDILKKYFSETRPRNKYEKENDSEIKIIAFDIPEKYRRKRWWLRGAVKSMGFTMLQKSVWVGKFKLPQEFIGDIKFMGLLPYVEILAVTKTGSLKELTR
ncbi:MAG: hypothetical protein A2945_02490 [Candidatus Liptonbacteria bacterium RIFCSPLOWO2_01_FULL_52_25]|uniref:Transcriptional repressor PaaX-like central Cas2-like domain-containing protein n=1 Tax=Candidatus Liptonbacteria bacterium RIFCSPLOWO2_01_FULL_52_25 TaxID=1798650 RepID=A0A1G2CEL4_9BACT|nr:MAG: hypothetical protein A2945_02490 [Candidatus Liptonbacteria bacterium RIFCSPLOWO2_01_FULL_52_25]